MTDGDTLRLVVVRRDGAETIVERIRIENVDAPEIEHADCPAERERALTAAAELVRIVREATSWEVLRTGEDRFGRTLARVLVDGADVGELLVAGGFARPWTGRSSDWCGN